MTQSVSQGQTIPVELDRVQTKGKNNKFIIGGLLIIGLIIYLIFTATMQTGAYYLTVTELNHQGASMVGERVRVSGDVVVGSEDWNPQEITLRFRVHDEAGAELPIVFYGPRPDNFVRAASAIIEGQLLEDGNFQADTLLLKCPSRYEEEPEEVFAEATR